MCLIEHQLKKCEQKSSQVQNFQLNRVPGHGRRDVLCALLHAEVRHAPHVLLAGADDAGVHAGVLLGDVRDSAYIENFHQNWDRETSLYEQ